MRDLFDLPQQVRKGDFVLQLSRGVESFDSGKSHFMRSAARGLGKLEHGVQIGALALAPLF